MSAQAVMGWLERRRAGYRAYAALVGEQATALLQEDFGRIRGLELERDRLAQGPLAEAVPGDLEALLASSGSVRAAYAETRGEMERALGLERAYRRGLESVLETTRAELAEVQGSGTPRSPYGRQPAGAGAGAALDLRR
ncbi:MAG: hypothetical protein R3E98_15325 [Gemmatimonadota bacterium]|nr:hypothetical protein [Gemmatimonadota bacterium]